MEGDEEVNDQFQEWYMANLRMWLGTERAEGSSHSHRTGSFKGWGRPLRKTGAFKLGFLECAQEPTSWKKEIQVEKIVCI